MAQRQKKKPEQSSFRLDLGRPNSDAQKKFFSSRTRFTAYGGARGGGKTWCSVRKAIGGAVRYPGIRILFLRREYEDLRSTVIDPILNIVPQELADYNGGLYILRFLNGSTIKFGNMPGYGAAVQGKYQGQEYDWIFMEEATQFTEQEFRGIGACMRGVNGIPKRFYLTCNPGGIGHHWVKRLFVEGRFQDDEDPDDYTFIKATVDDNLDLMESDPDYVKMLNSLPPDIRAAHRFGDWDALGGSYFPEFSRSMHTCKPFKIPKEWALYRCFDYGLDMFACLWVAVDFNGRCWVYREYAETDLPVSAAAEAMHAVTPDDERIQFTIAPPDMWNRRNDTGRNAAEIFLQSGVGIVKASSSRVQGWLTLKELLRPMEDGKPGIIIFDCCKGLIDFLPALQHDRVNPTDCDKNPHEITHLPDALRYFAVMRKNPATAPVYGMDADDEDEEMQTDYDTAMCGGVPSASYMYA